MSIATKLDRIVTYLEGLLGTKSSDPYNTGPCKITWKDGKLDRMLFYLEELLATKSHGPLITCCCKMTWQAKTIISPLPTATKLDSIVTYVEGPLAKSHMTLWSSGLAKAHDKLKSSYLHYHSTYSGQTYCNGDLPWVTPCHKVTWPFDHVVLQDHVTN